MSTFQVLPLQSRQNRLKTHQIQINIARLKTFSRLDAATCWVFVGVSKMEGRNMPSEDCVIPPAIGLLFNSDRSPCSVICFSFLPAISLSGGLRARLPKSSTSNLSLPSFGDFECSLFGFSLLFSFGGDAECTGEFGGFTSLATGIVLIRPDELFFILFKRDLQLWGALAL